MYRPQIVKNLILVPNDVSSYERTNSCVRVLVYGSLSHGGRTRIGGDHHVCETKTVIQLPYDRIALIRDFFWQGWFCRGKSHSSSHVSSQFC